MIKAEKAHITNLRADKARFEPATWRNIPNPTTPIRPETLGKVGNRIFDKWIYDPVKMQYKCLLDDGTIKYADLESIIDNKYDYLIVDFTPEKIKPKFTNCKNCGAPLKSDECEYCGTQYGK